MGRKRDYDQRDYDHGMIMVGQEGFGILAWWIGGLLILGNTGALVLVLFQLPGTWLMLFLTAMAAWWGWDQQWISLVTLIGMLGLAVTGELVEWLACVAASRQTGSSRRAAVLVFVGSLAGALVGTFWMPIIGTLLGGCVGAGAGAVLGDRWAGRSWRASVRAGQAAAGGKLWGVFAKGVMALLMWGLATAAVFVG